ncbi:hypothetical protein LGL55_20505 [Clostridium tagluense]|uniref:hypothetical protein n=1 Tax=Clostridium tagluense TaxID=360422 RepID=UPI001CF2E8DB|nr:hypothetical protein [Clostridium tagluense]MCB2313464.1 hypothetical protein [Clostridium tagluense]MCB2318269.1 hypothetical protein [Clostridium tagluense]MCB2323071.1 hypothetical protein [Clostridium tagluense]MCB2328053.1 hypothetical protein [Clostridium tagluense]MCB2332791.1 hypothetical protein [Clostridium tagluense]
MGKWGFLEWFSIISGLASIVSLIMVFVIKSEVVEVKNNINNSIDYSKNTTLGDESPVQEHSGQGNNIYKGGK